MPLFLHNTLTNKKEEFKPMEKNKVGLYTCGPTVYDYAHIGNLRTYIFEDLLKRTLKYNDYEVKHVMNITDVGHLTGDRDMGEDKIETGSKREGRSAWEIVEFYAEAFKTDLENLNIIPPDLWAKATEYIEEQIEMIKKLEEKGFTYTTSDGIYYDTSKFPEYNKLNHKNLEDLKEGARVEKNPEKKNPTDFALWKFSPKSEKRQMEWESPWGTGFPGWHIECSAMSLKELPNNLDIHCGGIDHIDVHHTNEIAQAEACTEKKFFNYWLHADFLIIKGGKKMAKSENNFLTLNNTYIEQGLDPLAFRFLCLQAHYRKPLEFNLVIRDSSLSALNSFREKVKDLGEEIGEVNKEYKEKFLEYINNDLNLAQALALTQEVLKSSLNNKEKLATVLDFDKVLGLNLKALISEIIPKEVRELVKERNEARDNKEYSKADEIRQKIEEKGYRVKDENQETKILKK